MKKRLRHSVPHYTYRESAKAEERVIYKRIGVVLLATTVLLVVLWFWGTNFVNLLGFLAKPEEPSTEPVINIPITKPTLNPLPEATNKEKINIEGRTSGGEEITLETSGTTLTTTSESDGLFSFPNVRLKKGLNLIKIYVLDSSGEKLEESIVITFDNTPPLLEISKPKNGQTFPSKTEKIKVAGKTEEEAVVFVNDLQAVVNPQGLFTFNYPAKEGFLKLTTKATDKAGNTKEVVVTVTVSQGKD